MTCYSVLADDLTGAMDAGLQAFNRGLSVHVVAEPESLQTVLHENSDCIVLNTQSRNLTKKDAESRLEAILNRMYLLDCKPMYKKIDSTLRGHIGAEIQAVLNGSLYDGVLLSPSLPILGRTLTLGNYYVNGVTLAQTELAQDPFAPVLNSSIKEIIFCETDTAVGLISLYDVRQGEEAVANALHFYHDQSIRIVAADAESEEDLYTIACGLRRSRLNFLPCGSAGLFAEVIPQNKEYISEEKEDVAKGPVLILSGSPAEMSKKQIRRLSEQMPNVKVIQAPPRNGTKAHGAIIQELLNDLAANKTVVLDAAGEGKAQIRTESAGAQQLAAESCQIQQLLGSAALAAVKSGHPLSGLVLFGGDTCVSVMKSLEVKGIKITGQAEPYIPYGKFVGGAYDGLPVITKAGGFGVPDSLVHIVRKLIGGK